MLSTSIFNSNGSVYNQSVVFGRDGTLNTTALEEFGLPAMTGSNAWSNFSQNLGIGALIAHVVLFWGGDLRDAVVSIRDKSRRKQNPHYLAMQKYKEAPWYWYMGLLLLAFIAGLSALRVRVPCRGGRTSSLSLSARSSRRSRRSCMGEWAAASPQIIS